MIAGNIQGWTVTVQCDDEVVFNWESTHHGLDSLSAIGEMVRASVSERFGAEPAVRRWTFFGDVNGRRCCLNRVPMGVDDVVELAERLLRHLTRAEARVPCLH